MKIVVNPFYLAAGGRSAGNLHKYSSHLQHTQKTADGRFGFGARQPQLSVQSYSRKGDVR